MATYSNYQSQCLKATTGIAEVPTNQKLRNGIKLEKMALAKSAESIMDSFGVQVRQRIQIQPRYPKLLANRSRRQVHRVSRQGKIK